MLRGRLKRTMSRLREELADFLVDRSPLSQPQNVFSMALMMRYCCWRSACVNYRAAQENRAVSTLTCQVMFVPPFPDLIYCDC